MNTELQALASQEQFGLGAKDDASKAAEKMLSEVFEKKDCAEKCTTNQDTKIEKFNRFAMPSEMNIEALNTPASMTLPSGEVIAQKGSNQRLSLTDGTSIDVNGDGTFAVYNAAGKRVRGDEILIKPGPGEVPRGTLLAFGDNLTAHLVDGTINFRTRRGVSIDVDNRGFASLSHPQSLRFDRGHRN